MSSIAIGQTSFAFEFQLKLKDSPFPTEQLTGHAILGRTPEDVTSGDVHQSEALRCRVGRMSPSRKDQQSGLNRVPVGQGIGTAKGRWKRYAISKLSATRGRDGVRAAKFAIGDSREWNDPHDMLHLVW